MTHYDILPVDEMRQLKRILGYTNEMLAVKSGVPLGTVQKIMAGITKKPHPKTLKALSDALLWEPSAISHDLDGSGWYEQYMKQRGMMVSEGAPAYGHKKKRYTTDDIDALPAGVRAELIDGQIYYMAAPSRTHQKIVGEMHLIVANYIRKKGGDCEVYLPPFDVFTHCDKYNVVQPDLVVICDPDKLDEKGCHGAPDWVVEVMSPSSKKVDSIVKLETYRKVHVREYWLIMPDKRTVIVYQFEAENDEESVILYSFDDEIPCRIYPDLTVNLSMF